MSSERSTSGTDAGDREHIPAHGVNLIRLSGVIRNYRCARAEASFVFADADRNTMGVISATASTVGLSGQAASTASAVASVTENADFVEFDLNSVPIKGWLWRSPFQEGDTVDVAAEWRGEYYEVGAIARPADRIIALCPHCSRGKISHIKNSIKWWLIGSLITMVGYMGIAAAIGMAWEIISDGYFYQIAGGSMAFIGLMTFSLSHKWMPFVRLTEKLCRTLGLSNPGDIDLVASSKRQRRGDDPGEFGTFYFRY